MTQTSCRWLEIDFGHSSYHLSKWKVFFRMSYRANSPLVSFGQMHFGNPFSICNIKDEYFSSKGANGTLHIFIHKPRAAPLTFFSPQDNFLVSATRGQQRSTGIPFHAPDAIVVRREILHEFQRSHCQCQSLPPQGLQRCKTIHTVNTSQKNLEK